MRVRIQDGDTNISLRLPTNLFLGKTMVKLGYAIGRRYAGESMGQIPPEALEIFCAELRRVKKKYGSWELVEIQSADGTHIHIVL